MRVNRMYFRGGKTPIFSLCAGIVALVILGGFGQVSRTEAEQNGRVADTPDWAKGMVWYQIFPERFKNANPDNDPQGWDLVTVDWNRPFECPTTEEIEGLWNRRVAAPRRYSSNPDQRGGVARNTIFNRRYGGDLQGVYEQLDELAQLGATGIYLCPIFDSRSLHKYDAWDHRHIDPTLGHPGMYTDPGPIGAALGMGEDPADETTWEWTASDVWFVEVFLPKAKSLGLRVVLDGVWNHVGLGHWAFRDVQLHGSASRFADWFDVRFDDEGRLIGWRAWDGENGNLPVFQQENGDLAPGPKAHMMAVTRRWMDPNGDGDPSDGIDGWRLDVANEVGRVFWKDWRDEVKSINPEALIIGEIWFDAADYFDGTAFDGQMNYPAAYAIADWLSIGGPLKGDGQVVAERLEAVFHHDRAHDLVQFNLMASHDTERIVSLMLNDFPRGFDQQAGRWSNADRYDAGEPDADAIRRALMGYATLVAMPGSVMIYNGDELAMPGADDPDNRRPIPWDSLSGEQLAFREAVSWLMHLRADPEIGEILRFGDAEFAAGESGHGLVIRRTLGSRVVEISIGETPAEPGMQRMEVPEALSPWLCVRLLGGL